MKHNANLLVIHHNTFMCETVIMEWMMCSWAKPAKKDK